MINHRKDSAKLIAKLRSLGISVKMLTGDSLPIAKQIAQEVGLGDKVSRMADVEGTRSQDAIVAAESLIKAMALLKFIRKASTVLSKGCRQKSMWLE